MIISNFSLSFSPLISFLIFPVPHSDGFSHVILEDCPTRLGLNVPTSLSYWLSWGVEHGLAISSKD